MATGIQPALTRPGDESVVQVPARERWIDLGLVILIAFVPLVFTAVYALFYPVQGTPEGTNGRFLSGLIRACGALALLAYVLRRQQRPFKDIGLSFRWTDLPKSIGLCLGAYLAYLIFTFILAWSTFLLSGSYPHYRSPRVIFAGGSVLLTFLYTLVAPVFEETLVRAYLMTELIGLSWPVWVAVLASVVLQGTYHLYYGVAGALGLSAGFAVWAIYFAMSRKIWPVLLAHFLWDLTATYLNWHR